MKIWIIQKISYSSYDYDRFCKIVAAFDDEQDADRYVKSLEATERASMQKLERCRNCSVVKRINDAIFACQKVSEIPDLDILLPGAYKYSKCDGRECVIIPFLNDSHNDYSEGVVCDTEQRLRADNEHFHYYEIVPIELNEHIQQKGVELNNYDVT